MRLADAAKKSEDNFKVLLNYRGKHDFTMEPCKYRGESKVVYSVPFDGMNYYIIAGEEAKRDDLFEAFGKFTANLTQCLEGAKNPYTAVLLFGGEKLEPVLTLDTSKAINDQEIMLVFGVRGETAILGFENSDLRASLERAFDEGRDLYDVRNGSERAIKAIFGEPDVTELMPPEASIHELADEHIDGASCSDGGGAARVVDDGDHLAEPD